ncbi:hypothetical protein [Streptomyces gibsoniae]|uniref:Uncharacterized protein n=1 Tax=Streptomyces gibsoniae TaxID=3075529 RepID=A0ABU2U2S2_9ACTN|nr:hypothetical protein [Streptomyces sp. DSM 41699]MDT0467528.1 hypothetical protein [Streptomyces sp. DSM 41699]
MTNKTMGEPVHLALPEGWPVPHPGCKVCGALAAERERAQASGDLSKVSDCNVEIREHKDAHPRRQR